MSKPLKGQVAIITGATRGIGRDIALRLAGVGCNIVVAGKSDQEDPKLPGTIYSVAKEVEAAGGGALPFKLDVTKDQQIADMVAATLAKWGRIDILINNAGALWWKKVVDTPMKRYDLINGVNSRGSFACTAAVLPTMLKQNSGRIIVMSPPIDLSMLPTHVAYCISKFGMTMLAYGLAKELEGTGVAINALWPATIVKSYASINHKLGSESLWRDPSILSDCVYKLVVEEKPEFRGHALIDEDYLRARGVTDFTKYRCDPNVEPPRISDAGWSAIGDVGMIVDTKQRPQSLNFTAKL